MTDRELMQQALEVLEFIRRIEQLGMVTDGTAKKAITTLRERLAQPEQEHIIDCPRCGHCCPQQPEQEPVAWTTMPDAYDWTFISGSSDPNGKLDGKWHPLYTTPQPAQQQGGGNLPPPLEQQPEQEPVAKVCHDLDGHIGWNPKLTELPDEGKAELRRLHALNHDLLEALKEIVDAADGDGWNQLDASFSKARAAIAKATEKRK